MAKSKIIKDLISGKIQLSQALERVLVIAMELGDLETIKWVKNEKNGYKDDVPEYRNVSLTPMGSYQLISMGYIHTYSNQVLPTMGLPASLKEKYSNHSIRDGISQIVEQHGQLTQNDDTRLGLSIPPELYQCFEEGTNIQVTNAYLYYSQFDLERIIDAVRTRVVELLVLLEKNFGVLDDLDIDVDDYNSDEIKKLQEACLMVIKGDNNGDINIITDSKIKKSSVGKNNSSDKESNVQINPNFSVEKDAPKTLWKRIIDFFGGKR